MTLEPISVSERCTCGKSWDDCALKSFRGKLHPADIALRCRLIRVARDRHEQENANGSRRSRLVRALGS